MEILVGLGLVLLLGGLTLMALCVLFFVLVWLIALLILGIQALWKAIVR